MSTPRVERSPLLSGFPAGPVGRAAVTPGDVGVLGADLSSARAAAVIVGSSVSGPVLAARPGRAARERGGLNQLPRAAPRGFADDFAGRCAPRPAGGR